MLFKKSDRDVNGIDIVGPVNSKVITGTVTPPPSFKPPMIAAMYGVPSPPKFNVAT